MSKPKYNTWILNVSIYIEIANGYNVQERKWVQTTE